MKVNLEEIKEALSKVTPGKWRVETEHDLWKAIKRGHGFSHTMIADCVHEKDSVLIANAPEWLASLVEQVEEMQKTLEWYADYDNYSTKNAHNGHDVIADYGELARKTLQSLKGAPHDPE